MKYLKYLVLSLLAVLTATSCTKDDPELNWEDADTSQAFVQVYYMSLVSTASTNNIKYITVNGVEYTYDHQAMISPYNFSPSYTVGSAYATRPGQCTIKLETESGTADTGYTRTTVYEGTTNEDLVAGQIHQVIVWDNENQSAPVVHKFGTPTVYNSYDETYNCTWASARFYNFMFDEPGVPTKARLYFDLRKEKNGEIYASYPEGGLAFGEATDYFDTYLDPAQMLSASRYVYIWHDVRAVWPDGTEKILLKSDYWSTYVGRSYHYFYRGSYNGSVRAHGLTRFTAK